MDHPKNISRTARVSSRRISYFEGFEIWIFRVEQICPAPLQWLQGNPRVKQIFYRYLVGGLEHFFIFHFIYVMSSGNPLTFTPSFSKMVIQNHQPDINSPCLLDFPGFPTGRVERIKRGGEIRRNPGEGYAPDATQPTEEHLEPRVLGLEFSAQKWVQHLGPTWQTWLRGWKTLLPCPYAPCNYGRFTYKTGWFLGQFCR